MYASPILHAFVKLRLIQRFVALSLVTAVGGHWFVLQSVAGVSMTMHFAQTDSISVALRKTFDGQRSSKLCKVVRAGRQADHKQTLHKVEARLDLLVACSPSLISTRSRVNWLLPDFSSPASLRALRRPIQGWWCGG